MLPEQVPYLEWLESSYVETDNCQTCHMPKVAGDAPISSVLGQARPDISQHVFLGGNAFMLRILNRYRDELGVVALPEELEAAAVSTEQHLAARSAVVEIGQARAEDSRVEFNVTIRSLAGHKLPTAYPSRRAWLHVTLRNGGGEVVFESGAPRPNGSIAGNDNDENGSIFEPHYRRVTSADQVQIYEPVMGDYAGRVTTGLIYGARYLKDNRILPRGFDKDGAPEDVAVHGHAVDDEDFVGGSDSIAYSVEVGDAVGPWTVTVELLYQSIGFRWAQNLRDYDALEPQRFVRYYEENAQDATKLLARQSATVN